MTQPDHEALIQALPRIAEVVNQFKSEAVQARAFDLLVYALGAEVSSSGNGATTKQRKQSKSRSVSKTPSTGVSIPGSAGGPKPRRASGPSQVKNLDLRPPNEISFVDFADAKSPRYANEQSLVASIWLRDHGDVSSINTDHIYTAYRAKGWKVPANLANHLQVVASKKAWLDTHDMHDIRVTIQGENYVLHDLPPKKGS
jgi:hypothetical protein